MTLFLNISVQDTNVPVLLCQNQSAVLQESTRMLQEKQTVSLAPQDMSARILQETHRNAVLVLIAVGVPQAVQHVIQVCTFTICTVVAFKPQSNNDDLDTGFDRRVAKLSTSDGQERNISSFLYYFLPFFHIFIPNSL